MVSNLVGPKSKPWVFGDGFEDQLKCFKVGRHIIQLWGLPRQLRFDQVTQIRDRPTSMCYYVGGIINHIMCHNLNNMFFCRLWFMYDGNNLWCCWCTSLYIYIYYVSHDISKYMPKAIHIIMLNHIINHLPMNWLVFLTPPLRSVQNPVSSLNPGWLRTDFPSWIVIVHNIPRQYIG